MKTLHKIFIGTGLATCVLGVGFAVSYGIYQDKCPQVAKAVAYDDENYKIELSLDDLSYVYDNLYDYITDNTPSFVGTTITYNNNTFNYNSINEPYPYYDYQTNSILFMNTFGSDEKVFAYYYDDTDELDFEYGITWNLNSTIYSGFKNAIELDIQANSPSQYTYFDFLTESIGLLVGAIVPTASGIGGGLSTFVNALAISNNGMSPFAAVIFIFGGIALALGLSRWVVNLISSLGQRNR